MKTPAPSCSPIAIEKDPPLTAANVLKTSGAPFPNARKVTPAISGESFKILEISDRVTQKYSSAVDPRR